MAILSATIWLHSLALALWVGGIVIIGAFVAPVAFSSLDRSAAGQIVGTTLRRFNKLCYFCSVILTLSEIIQFITVKDPGLGSLKIFLFIARGVLVIAMILMLLFLDQALFKKMDKLQAQGQMEEFNKSHERYESLSNIQLSLGVMVMLVDAFLRL